MSARCMVPPFAVTPGRRFVATRLLNDFVNVSKGNPSTDDLAAMLNSMQRCMKHAGIPTACLPGDLMERGLCAEEVSRG